MALYDIVEIIPLDQTGGSAATCINDDGVVGGMIFPDNPDPLFNQSQATIWHDPSAPQPIKELDGQLSQIWNINALGAVVGWYSSDDQTLNRRAFLFDGSSFVDLAKGLLSVEPSGERSSTATGIDNSGTVVGSFGEFAPGAAGFIYDPTTGIFSILSDSASGQAASFPYAINNGGLVAGTYLDGEGFVLSGGKIVDLGNKFNDISLNDSGVVVGTVGSFIFACDSSSAPPTLAQIPLPPGRFYGVPFGCNNLGHVVGACSDTLTDPQVGFLYDGFSSIELYKLVSAPGWTLSKAYATNNQGQIVGEGLLNGKTRGFVMTPKAGPPIGGPYSKRVLLLSVIDVLITILGFRAIDGTGSSIVISGGAPRKTGPVEPHGGHTAKTDALVSLAIDEIAKQISDKATQTSIRRAALESARDRIEVLLKQL